MKAQDKILFGIGSVVMVLALAGLVIGGLYWLLGQLDYNGLRWYALAITLGLPVAVAVTYNLATHAAREHLNGFERGLTGAQKTVETMGRSLSATASLARTARPAARNLPAGNDDLLPKVGTMRLVEASVNPDEMIDL